VLGLVIGAVAGGLLGYWAKCRSGTCPLTATPLRGVLFGAVLGGLIALSVARSRAGLGTGGEDGLPHVATMSAFREQVLASDRPVLVDFYAPWCPPCKKLAPVFAELAEDYAGRVLFVKVNTDEAGEIASEYSIRSIPTVILFSEGRVVRRWAGFHPSAGRKPYEDALKSVLSATAEHTQTPKEPAMPANTQTVTMKGNPMELSGTVPAEGDDAPDAVLVSNDLEEVKLSDLFGKTLIAASVPSLDTSVCSLETKRFNEEAAKLGDDVRVVVISMDLSFAQKRWCGAEGVENVTTLSDHREAAFGEAWGVLMPGPRLLARVVFVVDAGGKVRYRQVVNEVTNEPDYDDVLRAVEQVAGG
jgi:thiol peroxidase